MSVEASNFILTYSWTSTVWGSLYGAVFWAVKEDSAPPALQDFLCSIEVET